MHRILAEAKALTRADGGTLYIRTEDGELAFRIVLNDTLGIAPSPGEIGSEQSPVPLLDRDGQPNHRQRRQPHCPCPDVGQYRGRLRHRRVRFFRHARVRRAQPLPLALDAHHPADPARRRRDRRHPADQRARSETGAAQPFTIEVQRIAEAMASVAAAALFNRTLLDAQERLTDALIKVTVGAIDAKSPYTGGHCQRVPELAMIFAKAAGASRRGRSPRSASKRPRNGTNSRSAPGCTIAASSPRPSISSTRRPSWKQLQPHPRDPYALRGAVGATARSSCCGRSSMAPMPRRPGAIMPNVPRSCMTSSPSSPTAMSAASSNPSRSMSASGRSASASGCVISTTGSACPHIEAERFEDVAAPALPAPETLLADKPTPPAEARRRGGYLSRASRLQDEDSRECVRPGRDP